MALPGRKPKPPALKLIEGNPGQRAIPESPRPAPISPKQPRWRDIFGETSDGRQLAGDAASEWRRVVPVLDRLGLLSVIDGALLTDYCVCWARLLECERSLSRDGIAVEGERGWQKNPHLTAANQYRMALKNYIGELGLGPSSRGRLAVPGSKDAADDLLD